MITEFFKKLEEIIEKDPRYKPDAYEFVMQALGFTQRRLNRMGHITGRELLEGIKDLGLEQYGPMTKSVFAHWGVNNTDDFGEIVFNMVDKGLMGKNEQDSRNDFKNIYSFQDAFDSKRQFKL